MPLTPRTPAVLAAAALLSVAACSGGHGSGSGTPATAGAALALHGAYIPTNVSTTAHFSSITFLSASTYTAFKNGCLGRGCRVGGTYVFDGVGDLALTDNVSKVTQHITLGSITTQAATADAGTSAPSDLRIQDGLVNGTDSGGSGSLVTASPTALLPTIAAATMDGAPVQHLDDDPSADQADDATNPLVIPITAAPAVAQIMLSVGGSAPVLAVLDTGSIGIWVNPGILPAGHFVDIGPQNTGYGSGVMITGEAVRTWVRLSGTDANGNHVAFRTNEPIAIGEARSATCMASKPTCKNNPNNLLNMGQTQAIVGIGLGRTNASGLYSPVASMGQQSWQTIVHLGAPGNTSATFTIDPSDDMLAPFVPAQRVPLTTDGSDNPGMGGGFLTNNIPFCINNYCPPAGALLDTGESAIVVKDERDQSEYDQLGVPASEATLAQGSSQVNITGVALNMTILGVNAGMFPADPAPTNGNDLFQFRYPASGGYNLAVIAYRMLDVFYDGWNGAEGIAPLHAD